MVIIMKLIKNVELVNKLAYQNVVRKRAIIHYSGLEEQYKAFVCGIVDAGYTLKGPSLYSLNNVPTDEIVDIEMFFPIVENIFELEGYDFSSYMELKSLVRRIITDNFETVTEYAYTELLSVLEINQLEINTPFYHKIPMNGCKYAEVLLGYRNKSEEVFE